MPQDGALLRGEVLARWQDFVGTGEFFRAMEQNIGRFRDRVGARSSAVNRRRRSGWRRDRNRPAGGHRR